MGWGACRQSWALHLDCTSNPSIWCRGIDDFAVITLQSSLEWEAINFQNNLNSLKHLHVSSFQSNYQKAELKVSGWWRLTDTDRTWEWLTDCREARINSSGLLTVHTCILYVRYMGLHTYIEMDGGIRPFVWSPDIQINHWSDQVDNIIIILFMYFYDHNTFSLF